MQASKNTILLSTAYLPPVSWVEAAMRAGKVLIEAHESFPKQTYRNRCKVITANGIIPLSIPVKKISGHKTKTCDIEIFYDEPWQRLHWRTIDAAYSNSPFFLYYKDEIIPFYEKRYRFLLDFNLELSTSICRMLGIEVELILTKEFLHHAEGIEDLRNAYSPKINPVPALFKPYHQVFEERHGFIPDLSIIDLLFNEGPGAQDTMNLSPGTLS
ncbi:MAG: WbqC family protein [Bacteroidota bacterium]